MWALIAALTFCSMARAQSPRPHQHHRFPQPSPSSIPQIDDYPTTPEPVISDDPSHSLEIRETFQQEVYPTPIPIIRLSKQMALDGSYKSSYETGNSIVAEEQGFLKSIGDQGKEGIVQFGSYSYTDPLGRLITVRYTADEGGFKAEGEHLPTPPPVPLEVQKGLDIIFESIKQRQALEAEYRKNGAESANFPPEDDGSYKPDLYS